MRTLLLLLATAVAGAAHGGDTPMKIISYNVLEGFQRKTTSEAGSRWLREQDADVVALQELMNISADELSRLAASWGHPYSAIHKEEPGHPVGLTSRTPIEVIERRTEGMHHGYLHARTRGIDFFVLHLAPGASRQELRKVEARIMTGAITPLLEEKVPVIAMGDFNDLSPLDPLPWIRGKKAEQWDYDVLESFLDAGLLDAAHVMAQQQGTSVINTCPTLLGLKNPSREYLKTNSWRIDYILVCPRLRNVLRTVHVPREQILDTISDHYPVVVELDWPRKP